MHLLNDFLVQLLKSHYLIRSSPHPFSFYFTAETWMLICCGFNNFSQLFRSMRTHFEYFKSPLNSGPDQQRKDQSSKSQRSTQEPSYCNDNDLDDLSPKPDADSGCAMESQHQTIAWARARVYAYINGSCKSHHQYCAQQHYTLQ